MITKKQTIYLLDHHLNQKLLETNMNRKPQIMYQGSIVGTAEYTEEQQGYTVFLHSMKLMKLTSPWLLPK